MKRFGPIKSISFKSGAKAPNAMVVLKSRGAGEALLVFRDAAQIKKLKSFAKGDPIWVQGTSRAFSATTSILDVVAFKEFPAA